jgi:protein gp37
VTVTTVGYGDVSPKTGEGRLIAVALMFVGIGVIRVFTATLSSFFFSADVFEDRRDLDDARERLWQLIAETPSLDWQLLTKRPHAVRRLAPWGENWPDNVWLGTTVEDQDRADLRIPILLRIPARVRFLSCEPLIGPVDLSTLVCREGEIHWLIAGGESGPRSRLMDPACVRGLRDFYRHRAAAPVRARKIASHQLLLELLFVD